MGHLVILGLILVPSNAALAAIGDPPSSVLGVLGFTRAVSRILPATVAKVREEIDVLHVVVSVNQLRFPFSVYLLPEGPLKKRLLRHLGRRGSRLFLCVDAFFLFPFRDQGVLLCQGRSAERTS